MKLEIKLGEIIPVQCVTHLLHILMTLRFASRQICFPGSKAIISAIWMHVEEAETKAIRKVKCGAVKEELKFLRHGGEWKAKTRARERFS